MPLPIPVPIPILNPMLVSVFLAPSFPIQSIRALCSEVISSFQSQVNNPASFKCPYTSMPSPFCLVLNFFHRSPAYYQSIYLVCQTLVLNNVHLLLGFDLQHLLPLFLLSSKSSFLISNLSTRFLPQISSCTCAPCAVNLPLLTFQTSYSIFDLCCFLSFSFTLLNWMASFVRGRCQYHLPEWEGHHSFTRRTARTV